ncbi:MAG: carbonic anhydrase [Mycobacterium sp.]|nr:carbonic anhydrase [Mycobacterium sp.]
MSNPMSIWQQLRAGNEVPSIRKRARHKSVHQGAPVAAVFRCADTHLSSEMVFGQSQGALLDVSTWGHVVDTGVLATLEHAVDNLNTPLIVILGHQECTAMRAALRAWQNAELPNGASRLTIEQALSSILRLPTPATTAAELSSAHVVSVGMSLLEHSPLIAGRVDAGRCGIVCATTDHQGRISAHATVGALGEPSDSLLECV